MTKPNPSNPLAGIPIGAPLNFDPFKPSQDVYEFDDEQILNTVEFVNDKYEKLVRSSHEARKVFYLVLTCFFD